ncbi:MAG: HAD family phosphatase [Verrucomicrobiae bacterium]|nr:HAD family phosphatase [Verrucomicrobiae bacterium]
MEAVIFDLGNVLLPFNWDLAADRFCARTGCSRRELDEYIATTPFARELSLGRMSKEAFYRQLSRDFSFDGTYEEFASIWSEIFTPDEEMIRLAERLRGRHRRFLLSNTNPIHMDYIFAHYPFVRGFDGLVLSHEVGLLKPDRRIFELIRDRFALDPAGTVFIDDIAEHVEAAKTVGFHGIIHRDAKTTEAELTRLGVVPI